MVDALVDGDVSRSDNRPKRILAVVTTGGFTHAGEFYVLHRPLIEH